MFEPTSRYYKIPVQSIALPDIEGRPREIRYVKRRFIPPAREMTALLEHTVTEGDRLDVIATHYIGDPTQFWRICDANGAMRPEELTENIGLRIKIAMSRF
jgi:hypothetical protein